MIRRVPHILIVIAVSFVMLMKGVVGGDVLCIGEDGHVAIESPHQISTPAKSLETSPSAQEPNPEHGPCVDLVISDQVALRQSVGAIVDAHVIAVLPFLDVAVADLIVTSTNPAGRINPSEAALPGFRTHAPSVRDSSYLIPSAEVSGCSSLSRSSRAPRVCFRSAGEDPMYFKSVVCVLTASLLTGCQTYQRMPLDLPAHQSDVAGRDPAAGEVTAYAQHLASLGRNLGANYDPSDGLNLAEAEVVALFFNPNLRQARLQARVPQMAAREAGRWDDPELSVDVARILTSVDNPWVLGGMLSFTIPLSGRLAAAQRQALAEADAATLRAYLQERQVLAELRSRWLEWSALQQQVELTRQYLRELDDIVERTEKLQQVGEMDPLDARLFRIERAARKGSLLSLEFQQREALLAIKSSMGLAPGADIRLLPTISPGLAPMAATQPGQPELMSHPKVLLAKAEYMVADRTLETEIRGQYPDLTVGAGPGTEEGDRRVLFGLGIKLPLVNANRRAIAEARAARNAAKASAEAACQELVTELAQARMNDEAAQVRMEFLNKELVPLVDQQLGDARRLARLGEIQALISLEAHSKAFETKLEVLQAMLKQAQAANQLHTLLHADSVPIVESK